MHDFGLLVGRLIMAPLFLIAGWNKLTHIPRTAGHFAGLGIPYPDIATYLAIAVEIGLPVLIVLGLYTRSAAFGLFVFVLAATYFAHPFWAQDGAAAAASQGVALKNLALAGGLLVLSIMGGGRLAMRPGT